MRRAMTWVGVALCAGALLPPGRTTADVNEINAIGMIDYRRKPDFKVGDWVKYRVTGHNLKGAKDDYVLTILIAGEESFWGEDGFWVETRTESKSEPPNATASLMSYSIFDDSLPDQRMQLYRRKAIDEMSADGLPIPTVVQRSPGSLKVRKPYDDQIHVDVDTVGPDTVSVPRGLFRCVKVSVRQGKASTHDVGDSTEYFEAWDKRVDYYSRQIPITSMAREEIEVSYQQRKWQIGRSEDAPPMRYLDRGLAEVRLVDFGTGMKSIILTESVRKPLPGRGAVGAAPPPRTHQGAKKKSS